MNHPLLSIITVCFNAESVIEKTIQSIIQAKFKNKYFEYIIIDGGSTDATLHILDNYKADIDVLVSEKDSGIYDAMNKGQNVARAPYLWFINAGDEMESCEALDLVLNSIKNNPDVIYGDVWIVDQNRVKWGLRSDVTVHQLPHNLTWKKLKRGMIVCHQGFIAKKMIASKYLENNLSADIDWVINILKKSNKVIFIDVPLVKYLAGGISKQKWTQSLSDRFFILKHHFGLCSTLFSHIFIIFRAIKHRIIRYNKSHY